MTSLPQTLTPDEADYLTDLLKRSRRYLSDAASPNRIHEPNYASLAAEIGDVFDQLGIESE